MKLDQYKNAVVTRIQVQTIEKGEKLAEVMYETSGIPAEVEEIDGKYFVQFFATETEVTDLKLDESNN